MISVTPPLRVEDLAGLELFITAIRRSSISAAAREHHISQPSATERLRSLERRVGVTLLQRGPGGSLPTPAGEAFAGWALEVLAAVEHMSEGVAAIRGPGNHHPLRIMASLTIAEYVMPAWLHKHRVAGGAPVELTVGNSQLVVRAVESGDVQLGFIETPRTIVGLRSAVVGGDSLCLVVSPRHVWARRRSPVTPAMVAATPLLTRENGSGTRDAFEAAMEATGHPLGPPLAVMGSTTMLKAACVSGDGASVLSELAIGSELADGTLVTVAVTGLDLRRDFRALWRTSASDSEIKMFVRFARSVQP